MSWRRRRRRHRRAKSRLRSGKVVRAVGRRRPDGPAARVDMRHRSRTVGDDCRSGSVGVGARMASGDACDRQITHRAQSCAGWPGFCRAGCCPVVRRGRSERRRADQRRCPAAPARSWRGEGSGTRRQAATRRTRSRVSALEEGVCVALNQSPHSGRTQPARVGPIASWPVASKPTDLIFEPDGFPWRDCGRQKQHEGRTA